MQKIRLFSDYHDQSNERESTNEINIRGCFTPEWDAVYYFTDGFKVSIPLHLLDSVSNTVLKLMNHYQGDEFQHSLNNETLEFDVVVLNGGIITEIYERSDTDDEDYKGIAASFHELELKRAEVMKLLQLPDNDEWTIAIGINGCY
jgi:hypothetical protein